MSQNEFIWTEKNHQIGYTSRWIWKQHPDHRLKLSALLMDGQDQSSRGKRSKVHPAESRVILTCSCLILGSSIQELPVIGPVMKIETVKSSDAGSYTCQASNGVGQDLVASFVLSVRGTWIACQWLLVTCFTRHWVLSGHLVEMRRFLGARDFREVLHQFQLQPCKLSGLLLFCCSSGRFQLQIVSRRHFSNAKLTHISQRMSK